MVRQGYPGGSSVRSIFLYEKLRSLSVTSVGEDVARTVPRGTSAKTVKCLEGNMKCNHLVKGRISSCRALERPYVPSLFQLAEYCRRRQYRKCPFYLGSVACVDRMERGVSVSLSFSEM
jgi:hypothetical protein